PPGCEPWTTVPSSNAPSAEGAAGPKGWNRGSASCLRPAPPCVSPVPGKRVVQQGRQAAAAGAPRGQGALRLPGQPPGLPPALVGPQEPRVSQLPPAGVLLRPFAGVLGGALDVDQVVGDLEDQAEAAAETFQPFQQVRVGPAGPLALGGQDAQAEAG